MRINPASDSSFNNTCIGSGSRPQASWISGSVATPDVFDFSVPCCDCWMITSNSFRADEDTLVESDIFKLDGLIVDSAHRRCDPVGEFPRLDDAAHERLHISVIGPHRQPFTYTRLPHVRSEHFTGG